MNAMRKSISTTTRTVLNPSAIGSASRRPYMRVTLPYLASLDETRGQLPPARLARRHMPTSQAA
jgi:hypothetical protein